jgi:hypothetical protein
MNRTTIYKYPFTVDDRIRISMPRAAELLTVQVQHDQPCLWARVDLNAPAEERPFAIFGTGHPIPGDFSGRYVATFQMNGGWLVFHLFDLGSAC